MGCSQSSSPAAGNSAGDAHQSTERAGAGAGLRGLAFYNEHDPRTAEWLRELIRAGRIATGIVDTRDIQHIQEEDLGVFTQVHLFAGIGGWSLALRLAGWPDDRPVWTGSCPCNPFSLAGKGRAFDDSRHLWPSMLSLIRQHRPHTVFGEQVARAIEHSWLDIVASDLEGEEYAVGSVVLGAHSTKAPHIRQRLYWVADAAGDGREGVQRCTKAQVQKNWAPETLDAWHSPGDPFADWQVLLARSEFRCLADRVSSGLEVRPALRGFGNAIVPQVAAAFILAYRGLTEAA